MTEQVDKEARYRELVHKRKACRLCGAAFQKASVLHQGRFDFNEIGGYARWQGNLNARLVIIAKHFTNIKNLRSCQGWPDPSLKTNKSLVNLMRQAGFSLDLPTRNEEDRGEFLFTNVVLCIAQNEMDDAISPEHRGNCSKNFLRPMIDLIRPRIVVTLGVDALRGVLEAYYPSPTKDSLGSLIQQNRVFRLNDYSMLFPAFHPSRINPARDLPIWKRIGQAYRQKGT